jgi:hypothetical protein
MQLNALYKLIFTLSFVVSIDIPKEKIKALFSIILPIYLWLYKLPQLFGARFL